MTRKQLEAARNRAEDRAYEWYQKRGDVLGWYCILNKDGKMNPLENVYGINGRLCEEYALADNLIARNVDVYEEKADGSYKKCTRRAIAHIRRIEQKLQMWNDKCYYLDCAVDCWDESTGVPAYILRELENLNRGGTCRHDILTAY